MEETAYAKINLALRVLGRRADGYHDIDTLFAFARDGDRLSVEAADGLVLRVTGPFASALGDAEDNLVLHAARRLAGGRGAARSGRRPASILLRSRSAALPSA